jgi:Cdc6-like AAA superfamily ATPase
VEPCQIFCVNTCIDAWAKSGLPEAARKAEAILRKAGELAASTGREEMHPNTVTYNAVLDAWAKSNEKIAPEHAEAILNHMSELYE